ncbi:zinc ABC transporter substrate-binding protein [bacterium]|nr:zinc ABC transporter substrate-binding protein [candidate division CSSED10-310 bacterium]
MNGKERFITTNGKTWYLIPALLFLLFAVLPVMSSTLETFTGILPAAGLVEKIGGDSVEVHVLVKPGENPHTFEATPQQMMTLGKAEVFFQMGMPFEKRIIEKVQEGHKSLKVVDLSKSITRRTMNPGHDQEHLGHLEEDLKDPHIWLSPENLIHIVMTIKDSLTELRPENSDLYIRNSQSLIDSIKSVDASIRKLLKPYRGQSFYTYHPAFGYFGDAYGMRQIAVELEGKSPTPRQLSQLIEQAKKDGVKLLFVQPQFDKKSAETIARAIDGTVITLDPLEKDVLANLQHIADTMGAAFNSK